MKKLKIIVLSALAIVCLIIILLYASVSHSEYVQNGVIDLEHTPLMKEGVIPLNGEWEFYANRLLTHEDFLDLEALEPQYIDVPGTLSNMKVIEGIEKRGCGTYRVVMENVEAGRQYGIIKKNIRIASKIYVNGQLIIQDGRPAYSEADEIMGNSPQIASFSTDGGSTEIIIQVSNFKYYSFGVAEAIRFGFMENVIKENTRNIIFESIIFAIVIAIGIMYGILACLLPYVKKNDIASIFMPLAVIMFAVVNGSLSERVIKRMIPALSTEALIRIEYAAAAILFISMASAIYFMDKKLLPKTAVNLTQGIYGLLLLPIFFAPMKYYITWTIFTYITTGALLVGFAFVLMKYLVGKKINIRIQEHSFILILLFIMNVYNIDVFMFSFGYKYDMVIALIATAVYGITWLVWIIYRYKVAYRENEELSTKLLENHYAMERTSRSARRSEMAFLQAQIKPHFLFNSLSSILSLQRISPERAEKMMVSLSEYLKDLFDVDLSTEYIHIENEINIVRAYVDIEKERFGDRIDVKFDIEDDVLHCRIIPLLIQPLVENAMHHGALKREAGGEVMLTVAREDDYISVIVQDNGPGFSERAMKKLKQKDISQEHGGVGVKNIIERLQCYYGEELHILNKEGGGVKIWFRVPLPEKGDTLAKNCDS